MIYSETKIGISDNSGVKIGKCIKVLKSSKSSGAKPANIVVISARKVKFSKRIIKGEICRGVVIRLKKNVERESGVFISCIDNSVILIDQKNVPLGTRIFGPILKELKYDNFPKVISLAKTIL